uniref:Uncharacterized protein n=1 Tax=Cyprinus carpio TaxID=7962 RepID=A0A8C1IBI6_CYPCA
MASTLSLYLMCPVCLSDFNDPVSLPCEHVFCRQCITSYLESHEGAHKCPECRQNFTRQDLKGNRVLKNVVDVLQQQKLKTRQQTPKNAQEMLCSEHMEPLKLFCENDQRLVCLICKEGEKHCGHSFKPVKEAMEISEERAKRLEEKMHVQFNKMHDFLRKKEEEMVRQLHRQASSAEVTMKQNASFLSKLQINGNNQESILESGLQMSQPERFLEVNSLYSLKHKYKNHLNTFETILFHRFKSRLDGTRVISDHFTLGPYETDLPLIVWRDMLGSVKQVYYLLRFIGECLFPDIFFSLDLSDTSTIDKDLKLTIKKESHLQSQGEDYFNIHPGQVYWEVDVGAEAGWEHGLTVRFYPKEKKGSVWQTLFSKSFENISLSVKNDRLYAVRAGEETLIVTQIIPSRVGVYVDSEKRQVVFCNADNMSLLHTVDFGSYTLRSPCSYKGSCINWHIQK